MLFANVFICIQLTNDMLFYFLVIITTIKINYFHNP